MQISCFLVTCADRRGAGVWFVKDFRMFWDEKGLFGNWAGRKDKKLGFIMTYCGI